MKRLFSSILCGLTLLLTACSTPPSPVESVNASAPARDEQAFEALIQQFSSQVKAQWGERDYLEAGKHDYVKYIDGFRTRAHINFDQGKIWVSTIARNQPREKLHQAIVETLLMPSDPSAVHMFSDERVELKGKPFLLGQVVDQDKQPIEWTWRANRYADYLIAHQLQQQTLPRGQTYFVEIDMVSNHLSQREYQYAPLIRAAARRYNLPEDLLYAIIKTESSFNPYAVSHAGAYGLMQVIPKTAGADVFKLVKGKSGMPTQAYLFDPASNIDTGAAYFHLLKTRYLREVKHPTTLHYAMISAYNGGTGGVLATFDRDRKRAMRDLNSLQPDQVYWALTNRHPKAEARRYLQKVLAFQREFNEGAL
ncbi:membrane-bound lytic murein transglycosylase MltC [Marinobacter hydrocarbonoclasticus]|nr:membrane-bound lytic murein transglycosylase MltC [Marinobacter nauticus]